TLRLENGKTFSVQTRNQAKENVYIQKVELNGEELNTSVLKHSDISNGGVLIFHLGKVPNHAWGKL
ncbi:MAG: glycoside hydrolase domain-containing protein, partial [Allomuricauda sp.]